MKHKSSKRSNTNKHQQQRRSSTSTNSTILFNTSTISTKKVDLGVGTVHLDSHTPCLKPNTISRSQKALKRDLLLCSDQRPSLLGVQTLQPPRLHHGFQPMHTASSSSSTDRLQPARRQSLSVHSRAFYAAIDRIGPWPDVSISRLRSDGNELLRPLKNFRNLKNPRVFSPKYYAALTENSGKFKFFSQTRNYIDEYRKQKGYVLDARNHPQLAPLPPSISFPIQLSEDEQTMVIGEFNVRTTNETDGTAKDRAILSTADLSVSNKLANESSEQVPTNTPPSIPSGTKLFSEAQYSKNLPTGTTRNGQSRLIRQPPITFHSFINQQTQFQQPVVLPSLNTSTSHYLTSINSVEKAYANSKKATSYVPSKLFLIDNRHKRRISQRIHSDTEISSRSHDYSELRATGGPIITDSQRTTSVVVYQFPRRPPPLAVSRADVESFI